MKQRVIAPELRVPDDWIFIPHSGISRAYRAEQFRKAFAVPQSNRAAPHRNDGTAKP